MKEGVALEDREEGLGGSSTKLGLGLGIGIIRALLQLLSTGDTFIARRWQR